MCLTLEDNVYVEILKYWGTSDNNAFDVLKSKPLHTKITAP